MAGLRANRSSVFLIAAIAAALAALGVWAAVALAAEDVTASAVCCKYDKSTYSSDQGETARLINPADADSSHNVMAKLKAPDGLALFRSKTISAGKSTLIDGLQYLPGGSYKFVCTIHGPPMVGTYVVDGSKGTPVARPKIDVTIPAQTLNKVRNSGKLTVKVKALTKSAGISIEARKGAKLIGKQTGLTLAAGASRTLKIALSAKGRKALKGLDSASVSANGSVPFGKPDSARRTLR